MCAGNGIVHRKLIENRLGSFMFLDGELRKKIQQLRISMKCESCEYLENSGKGGVLTGRPLLTLKISIIGYLHFCTAACVHEWLRHNIAPVQGRCVTEYDDG